MKNLAKIINRSVVLKNVKFLPSIRALTLLETTYQGGG